MSEPLPVSLGFSPCPNDTHIFNGLVHGKVELAHCRLANVHLEDVETLNEWALQGRLDVTKLSFHAFGHVQDRYTLLRAGAALGRGCGPLLIAGTGDKPADLADWKIAIPGTYTTAALLLRLYRPDCRQLVAMRFDRIMEALAAGQVDGGVIIHESRFTYQAMGLHCIRDLGQWWEETTGLPIPLGCIAARKTLPLAVRTELDAAIAASIRWSEAHAAEGLDYIKAHAQEMDPQVMRDHIALYVNDYSTELGEEGMHAVRQLLRRGTEAGLFAAVDGGV
ncbi:MAG: 1,4-dihydroxy-6-naphthoate synthase [Desulfobulbus sp.]|jgi:1,4-dihydroxy-6-naphthoate synthase|uniref:1,4-dihydroxy-6-naphthoate synthase n=1 Tax=Desulfobulbus sp. TaxID=895 RepID=UPI00284EC44A|nr:1,4-dihydroxy-6-naphthoate synthase [Desulfobulbus sp.]MDR2550705.1 1,4-dihydroxy-6-naphthoate synthase [Desulfobulbus sp.]